MKAVTIMPVLAMFLAPALAVADPGASPPHVLYSGSLLCKSPDVYQAAAKADDASARAHALEANECMTVSEDDIEEMLAPFVTVVEQRGDMVLVQYAVEYEDKIELLHRKVAHVRYTGWTAQSNLRNYHEWLTGKPQS